MARKSCESTDDEPAFFRAARAAALVAAIATLSLGVDAAPPSAARLLEHVELRVNGRTYTMIEPTSDREMLDRMKAMAPKMATWGRLGWGHDNIGFDQYFIAPDQSGVHVIVAMPETVGPSLKPGTYRLGGVTRRDMVKFSTEGWSGVCADDETPISTIVLRHFGRPGPDDPRMPMVPNGPLEKDFQTHTLHLHQDKATLTLTAVDLLHRWIEGTASGEASWLEPKITLEKTGRGMGPEEACNPANYEIHTEPFELQFAMHVDRRWTP